MQLQGVENEEAESRGKFISSYGKIEGVEDV